MGSIASPLVASQYYEKPFIYVKNYFNSYTGAPAGVSATFGDAIRSQGDSDFFARAARNMFNFNDMNGQTFITGPGQNSLASIYINTSSGIPIDYPLAPEKLYTRGADIPIQMAYATGLVKPTIASLSFPGAPTANVNVASAMMQGVKRFRGVPATQPNYSYNEQGYRYTLSFDQDWTYLLTPYPSLQADAPRSFSTTVNNYDFELQALEFSADFNNTHSGYNGYMIMLYDANGNAVMNDFVHYRFLTYNGGFDGDQLGANGLPGNTFVWSPNCFPVPGLVYPKGSTIKIDVLSLLDTAHGGGGTQTIHFRGVQRLAC